MSTQNIRFKQDPQAEIEAQKYERPIPSRDYILQLLRDRGEPVGFEAVAVAYQLEDEQDLEALRRRLKAMLRDGQLMQNRRGDFAVVDKMDLIRGRVIGHPDGFGFLVPDDGSSDLFITPKRMRGLLHGDRVLVREAGLDQRGRREAAPVEVLERANTHIVGRLHLEHGICFVVPSNKHLNQQILVAAEDRGAALEGQIVVVELIEQPTWRSQPIGKVSEVLGEDMAPGMEIDIALRSYEIPTEWPRAVQEQIASLGREVPEAAKQGREDIRQLPLVTIDGEDARDFDDAVYCAPQGRGWRLLVAIADVSHYVLPDTPLDEEATKRGNSVYFPGRVIPMLPEILSNGLCSINPQVDRLCMVCDMEISASGVVKDFRFFEGVMRSAARLTYNEVAAMVVERTAAVIKQYAEVYPHLENLHELYKALRTQREKRGAIDFETVETRIIFGDQRKIREIVPVVRNDAHKLIEEMMIAANVAAAEYLQKNKIPALYRVHSGPTEEKLTGLRAFLGEFGLKLGGGEDPEPRHYSKVLDEIKDKPEAELIQTVLLRSLSQAVYTPENDGHFGLAFDAYTHFTSPIRRYPDLVVHRALRALVRRERKNYIFSDNDMQLVGEHCSMTERRADDATRDAMDWLKCEYMRSEVGEEYEGRITGVTNFGIFVMLKDVYVEGLVHITGLGKDYFHFEQTKHRLMGERTGRIFRLFDTVRVRVVRVNLEDKKIDFELAGEPEAAVKTKTKVDGEKREGGAARRGKRRKRR
ncbi:MAG: ribonuclease R [Pseudomonadota bacterium]